MQFLRRLFMSKVSRLKEERNSDGLFQLVAFDSLGGTESIPQSKEALVAMVELGRIRAHIANLLIALITEKQSKGVCDSAAQLGGLNDATQEETTLIAGFLAFTYCIYAVQEDEDHVAIRTACAKSLRQLPASAQQSIVSNLLGCWIDAGGIISGSGIHNMKVELLGEIARGPEVIARLRSLLEDPYAGWSNRAAAARALGKVGGQEALTILENNKDIFDSWVREDVVEAIKHIKGSKT